MDYKVAQKLAKDTMTIIMRAQKLLTELTFVRGGIYDQEIKVTLSKIMRNIVLSSKIRDSLAFRLLRKHKEEALLFLPRDYQEAILVLYYGMGRKLIRVLPPGSIPRSDYDLFVAPFQSAPIGLPPSS